MGRDCFQNALGLVVPQLYGAVVPGVGRIQLLQHLDHHIVRGLVDEGDEHLLTVELIGAVCVFGRGGLADLPDEVPGEAFRQGEAQLFHKIFVHVAGLCGAHIGQGIGGAPNGALRKKLGHDFIPGGGVKCQSAAPQAVVGVVHQAV